MLLVVVVKRGGRRREKGLEVGGLEMVHGVGKVGESEVFAIPVPIPFQQS